MIAVTAPEMRAIDRLAIEKYRVPGATLMENAGRVVAEAIVAEFPHVKAGRVIIVAGKGNNGGDGFVAARALRRAGTKSSVALLGRRDQVKGDAALKLAEYVKSRGRMREVTDTAGITELQTDLASSALVVDAILGTGLSGKVKGLAADAIELINCCGRPVVAIDIPSGLDSERGLPLGACIQAELTVTLAAPKIGLLIYPGAALAGRLLLADIGIPEGAFDEVGPKQEALVAPEVGAKIPPRAPDSHKGTHGHLGIIAGSPGKTGAAILCGRAAQRAGAGLVTVACPASLNPVLESALVEVMTRPLADGGSGEFGRLAAEDLAHFLEGKQAAVIGPGLGSSPGQRDLVRALVGRCKLPLVVDADGLNCLVENASCLASAPGARILTPHPGEMARLVGTRPAEVQADRVGAARAFAREHRCFLLLKGARTVIASPQGRIAISLSGNPGLASGGTGDVLAGIIGALLAQGYSPQDASDVGVFVHGHAADIMAGRRGEIGLIASDIVDCLPEAFSSARREFEAADAEERD